MRTRFVIAALTVLVPPAMAQTTGSRLPGSQSAMVASFGDTSRDMSEDDPRNTRPSDEAAMVGRKLARCAVQQRRERVEEYLAARSAKLQELALQRVQPILGGCLMVVGGPVPTNMRMSVSAFRGALAEALLARRPVTELAVVEPSRTEVPYWLSETANQRVVEEMAVCLAWRHPAGSIGLVHSRAGTAEEAAAFKAIVPIMGTCLIKDATLRANRTGIRLALANAVYHRLVDEGDRAMPQVKK